MDHHALHLIHDVWIIMRSTSWHGVFVWDVLPCFLISHHALHEEEHSRTE